MKKIPLGSQKDILIDITRFILLVIRRLEIMKLSKGSILVYNSHGATNVYYMGSYVILIEDLGDTINIRRINKGSDLSEMQRELRHEVCNREKYRFDVVWKPDKY